MTRVEEAKRLFESVRNKPVVSITPYGTKGTANDIFLVNENEILRLKNLVPTDEGYFSPSEEKRILEAVMKACPAVAPHLFYYDEKTGNKIESFQKGHPLTDSCGKSGTFAELSSVIGLLRDLHAIHGDFPVWNVQTRQREWSAKAADFKTKNPGFLEDYPDISFLRNEPYVLCHNDLHSGNILILEDGAVLLDFEFAGNNTASFDLASLLSENGVSEDDGSKLIHLYYGGEYSPEKEARIWTLVRFEHVLWRDWAICRFLDTGKERFLEIARMKERLADASRKAGH